MADYQTAESKNSQFSVARLIVAVGLACCAFGALRFSCQSLHLPVAAFVLLAIVILPAIVLPALIGTWWSTAKVTIREADCRFGNHHEFPVRVGFGRAWELSQTAAQ